MRDGEDRPTSKVLLSSKAARGRRSDQTFQFFDGIGGVIFRDINLAWRTISETPASVDGRRGLALHGSLYGFANCQNIQMENCSIFCEPASTSPLDSIRSRRRPMEVHTIRHVSKVDLALAMAGGLAPPSPGFGVGGGFVGKAATRQISDLTKVSQKHAGLFSAAQF